MCGRRVFQLPERDGGVFVSSDGGGEGGTDSEEVVDCACAVELQRAQTERAGVDLWVRRSIAPGGFVTSPDWEMSQSIRLARNHAGKPTIEPDKVFPFVSGGSDCPLTCFI